MPADGDAESPHDAYAVTGVGTVMETSGYMALEQARGQTVDHRADVFAFGAVLYEMLSGERAFKGATSADTMTAVLTRDQQWMVGIDGGDLRKVAGEAPGAVYANIANGDAVILVATSGRAVFSALLAAGIGTSHGRCEVLAVRLRAAQQRRLSASHFTATPLQALFPG